MPKLNRFRFVLEVYRSVSTLIGILLVWIGLALGNDWIIYVGTIVILIAPWCYLISAPMPPGAPPKEATVLILYGILFIEFIVGVVAYVMFHSDLILEQCQQLFGLRGQELKQFFSFMLWPSALWGMISVLWIKTVLTVRDQIGTAGSTVQKDYEELWKNHGDRPTIAVLVAEMNLHVVRVRASCPMFD